MIAALLCVVSCSSSTPPDQATLPPIEESAEVSPWQRDLEVLAEELPARHIDAFHTVSETDWRSAVADAALEAPEWSSTEGYFEVARLVALIGDGHTSVVSTQGVARYPVAVTRFADGIFVTATDAANADLLGGRLQAVDGISVEALMVEGASLVSGDDLGSRDLGSRDFGSRDLGVVSLLTSPDFVAATGLDRVAPGSVTVEVSGSAEQRSVAPIIGSPRAVLTSVVERPPLLVESRPAANYWTTDIAEANAIYMNYRLAQEADDLPMSDVADLVTAASDQVGYDRLIIDLRQNPGGNSLVLAPLIDALDSHRLGDNVAVLIGPRTYSSAVLNALELQERLGAVLIGAESTQSVSHFGEVRRFTLPESGLVINYSTKFFDRGDSAPLSPDIAIATTAADVFAGVDAVLDAALRRD